jgi:hypothetical protein
MISLAFVASDVSAEVPNRIFGIRKKAIFLFSKPRQIRTIHKSDGWWAESLAAEMLPASRPSFYPNERWGDVLARNPI